MNRALVLVAAAGLGLASLGSSLAQTPTDRIVKYRQDVLGAIGYNFGALSAMVQGRRPWDGAEFERRAAHVSMLAQMMSADEMFPPGSGEGVVTDAKPDIWENFADFTGKMTALKTETSELAAIARNGDEAAIKAQFAKTGGSCKACHDEYKAD